MAEAVKVDISVISQIGQEHGVLYYTLESTIAIVADDANKCFGGDQSLSY